MKLSSGVLFTIACQTINLLLMVAFIIGMLTVGCDMQAREKERQEFWKAHDERMERLYPRK